jgi:hypothetical protein
MNDKSKKFWKNVLITIVVIAIIILTILSLGLIFRKEKKEDIQIKEVDENQKRLEEIECRIAEIELRKKATEKTKKRIFLFARIGISLIILIINYLYIFIYKKHFTLSYLLNFNYFILLSYSFIAFIIYGTPSKLVSSLKYMIVQILRRNRIDITEELEKLTKERTFIKSKMEILENNLNNKQ